MTAARADAHYVAGQFDQAVFFARKALARNPRSTRTMRILAASLAKAGERQEAADVIRGILALESGLTIAKMRARLNFWPEDLWNKLADGLRLAGLPE